MPKAEYDIPCVGPPRLIAYKPEPKQTPHVGKVASTCISILPTVPGNDSDGLFHFPTAIAACGGYNIRGGGVIVNLFFLHCRFQRLNPNRMCISLCVTIASSSVSPSCTANCWKMKQTSRGWEQLVYLQQEIENKFIRNNDCLDNLPGMTKSSPSVVGKGS